MVKEWGLYFSGVYKGAMDPLPWKNFILPPLPIGEGRLRGIKIFPRERIKPLRQPLEKNNPHFLAITYRFILQISQKSVALKQLLWLLSRIEIELNTTSYRHNLINQIMQVKKIISELFPQQYCNPLALFPKFLISTIIKELFYSQG